MGQPDPSHFQKAAVPARYAVAEKHLSQTRDEALRPGFSHAGGLDYTTSYLYDGRDLLKQVTQGSQTRTFNYDGLGRLRDATNPETGIISYEYYGDGTLKTKTHGAVVTSMNYDELQRMVSKSYTGVTTLQSRSATTEPLLATVRVRRRLGRSWGGSP